MKTSRKEFIAEAEELLEESQKFVLEIDETLSTGCNPETINALFRTMHTLKGISGLFGFQVITDISHALETLMDDIRLGRIEANREVLDFLFRNLDILNGLVAAVSRGEEDLKIGGSLDEIESFRVSQRGRQSQDTSGEELDESIMKVLSEYEEHRLRTNIKEGKGIYMAKAVIGLDVFEKSIEKFTNAIKSKGELISTLPSSVDLPDGFLGFSLIFGSSRPVDEIKKDMDYEVDTLIKPRITHQPAFAPMTRQETPLKSKTTTVRVDIEKLDRILNTIGELTLAKGAVKRIGIELVEDYGHTTLVYDVHKISQTLERRLAELQDQVLEVRMVPIGQIFARLGQVARRYSRETSKQIELAMFGEDTELDKYLAEEIVDPLMHLMRNSIDHGIESPIERKKKGKKETGTISLKAYQKGNHVLIAIRDDGAGIDIERVREKAIEKGLITADSGLDEKEIIDLIFTPGFSTMDTVSEVSGRGVGMDVVKEKLSALGGFAEIESIKDAGTSFTLTLPITLAIIKALLVRVGSEKFAVPLTSMTETLVVDDRDIQTIEWKEVYYLRGEMLPMIRLNRFFELEGDKSGRSFAVVVSFGEKRVGLLVDELFGQHEIVIKSLGDYLDKLRGFAGAAEIGKHEVILVLDIESVIAKSGIK